MTNGKVFVSVCDPTAGCTTDDGATCGTIIVCVKNKGIRQKRLKNIYKAIFTCELNLKLAKGLSVGFTRAG